MYATPFDNYWIVGDQPSNVRWSSKNVTYVADNDATYVQWGADGYDTCIIASEQELADLLNETYPAGSPIPAPPPSTALLGPMSVDLIQATTLLAALGEAINGIQSIEVIEGQRDEAVNLPDDPGIGLFTTGADTVGSYVVPADVYKLIIFGQAAGGCGGQCTAATAQSGGGGGPGETRCMVLAVQPGQVLDYVIGGRSLAGTAGVAGDLVIGGSAAAFPVIVASKPYVEGPKTYTHVITLPTGITAGDLILVYFEYTSGTITTPSGWTIGFATTFPFFVGPARASMIWKIADGTEGTSISLTTVDFVTLQAITHRIRGHDPATPFVNATAVAANTSNKTPNPPPLTIPGGLAKAVLWIASCHTEDYINTGIPGWTLTIDPNNVRQMATCQLNSNVAVNDPPAYGNTTDRFSGWLCATTAVLPATPVSLMRCKGGLPGLNAAGGSNGALGGDPPTGSGGVRIPPAGNSWVIAQSTMCYSRGGSSFFGLGGENVRTSTMGGMAGQGPGAGGSGGANGSGTTAQAGADGAPGMILIFGFGK